MVFSSLGQVSPMAMMHMPKFNSPLRCLVTGVGGQDGTYLALELIGQGYSVVGLGTRPSGIALPGVEILEVDYADSQGLLALLNSIRPHHIYHLASPSSLSDTVEFEAAVLRLNLIATHVFLRWIYDTSFDSRFFFAGSSEIFGDPVISPQNETTPSRPTHPYAIAKLAGQHLVDHFRQDKQIFACSGILYNHESPLRRPQFVTRKIIQGAVAISRGERSFLALGNLQARRDWSHAADFARAFRLILNADEPANYVIGSGQGRTVAEFCETAFAEVGLDYRNYVTEDPQSYRADFSHPRIADPSRLRDKLGWRPEYDFKALIREMIRAEGGEIMGGALP
jgi:GDPmannose 4,6-dehydratase